MMPSQPPSGPTPDAGAVARPRWWGWAAHVLEYLLGFLSLSVFAAYALSRGDTPTDQFWIDAFRLVSPIAALECLAMRRLPMPPNRLVLGANLWLMLGGAASWIHWWDLLRLYQYIGEVSLFMAMMLVGVLTIARSEAGFVGAAGPAEAVRRASWLLLLAVMVAAGWAWWMSGHYGASSVAPVIALAWLNRALKFYVRRQALKLPANVSGVPPHV